jgi:hypothetical protein
MLVPESKTIRLCVLLGVLEAARSTLKKVVKNNVVLNFSASARIGIKQKHFVGKGFHPSFS